MRTKLRLVILIVVLIAVLMALAACGASPMTWAG